MFLSVGLFKSHSFQNDIIKGKDENYLIQKFDESFYVKSSITSQKSLAAFLYTEKSDAKASFKNYKYMPIELILQKSISSNIFFQFSLHARLMRKERDVHDETGTGRHRPPVTDAAQPSGSHAGTVC